MLVRVEHRPGGHLPHPIYRGHPGGADRSVGCRNHVRHLAGPERRQPFQVPGTGSVTTARAWQGAEVPPYFFHLQRLEPARCDRPGTLKGGAVSTVPGQFVIGRWGSQSCDTPGLWDDPWTYSPQGSPSPAIVPMRSSGRSRRFQRAEV